MLQWTCVICPRFLASGLGCTFQGSEERMQRKNLRIKWNAKQAVPFPVGWTVLSKPLKSPTTFSFHLSLCLIALLPLIFFSQPIPTCWGPWQRCVRKKRTDFSLLSVSDRKTSDFFQDKNSRSFSRCLFISLIFSLCLCMPHPFCLLMYFLFRDEPGVGCDTDCFSFSF